MTTHEKLRCPVCKARFRSSTDCSRCGADLTKLMVLATRAHCLVQAANDAIEQRYIDKAKKLVYSASVIHNTSVTKELMSKLHATQAD